MVRKRSLIVETQPLADPIRVHRRFSNSTAACYAGITGNAVDAQGAAVAGVQIVLTDVARAQQRTVGTMPRVYSPSRLFP
jgi:hypothetical protein